MPPHLKLVAKDGQAPATKAPGRQMQGAAAGSILTQLYGLARDTIEQPEVMIPLLQNRPEIAEAVIRLAEMGGAMPPPGYDGPGPVA